jgi:hypothetical protein
MAQELRLACTQGVLLSLERDQRIAWILAEIFELFSEGAATVLEIEIPGVPQAAIARPRTPRDLDAQPKAFPNDQAPPAVLANVRALSDSGRYCVFDT